MGTKSKVFGIGFHKTGTSSLANALYILGYNVTGYFGVHDPNLENNICDQAYMIGYRYDAAQDTPWPILYKDLDQWFPGSKFILTVRATDAWIRSVTRHFKRHRIPAHEWIYGVSTAIGNERAYIRRYEEHNLAVLEYFNDRPADFLSMDIAGGDGWEKLCPFLGVETPPFDFPIQNAAAQRSKNLVQRVARYMIRKMDPQSFPTAGSQLPSGVTSAFLRDVLHYYFSLFDNIWEAANRLSEEEFIRSNAGQQDSLADYLLRQAHEMYVWCQRLKRENLLMDFAIPPEDCPTREGLLQVWKQARFLLRRHAANLTDEDCNAKLPARNETVWEVYLHLMNTGTQHGTEIRRRLEDFGIPVQLPSVIDFFYHRTETQAEQRKPCADNRKGFWKALEPH